MFTGIIEDIGSVRNVTVRNRSSVLEIATRLTDIQLGESISVNGTCLTVVQVKPSAFVVEVSPETLSRTTLKEVKALKLVNLERALAVGERLGGHFVSGHVDRIGIVRKKTPIGDFITLEVSYPQELSRYIAPKGSIAVDGVSLTVVENRKGKFSISVIPYTLHHSTLGGFRVGSPVNLEVDLLAKYVENMMDNRYGNHRH